MRLVYGNSVNPMGANLHHREHIRLHSHKTAVNEDFFARKVAAVG
jgi:hypothetical protein